MASQRDKIAIGLVIYKTVETTSLEVMMAAVTSEDARMVVATGDEATDN